MVNEAIKIDDRQPNSLRKTPWLEFLGPDYEYDTPEDKVKRDAVLKLLENLKSKEVPIYALGIQSHLNGSKIRFGHKKLQNFLSNVANLGLKILITEMDVTDT